MSVVTPRHPHNRFVVVRVDILLMTHPTVKKSFDIFVRLFSRFAMNSNALPVPVVQLYFF